MILGIDISQRDVAVILAKPDGSAELALREDLPRIGGANAVWLAVVEVVRQILLQGHVVASQIEKTGVAFFAPLDINGMVAKDSRGANWAGFDLKRAVKEHLGIENCSVQTRVRCEALAEEKFGALRECENWLYVHLGQNVEAAARVEGVLPLGASRAALELGAVCIDRDGALGESGRRGTLDAYCGEDAFMARARGYALTFQTAGEIWESSATNAMAKSLCDDFIARLAQGLGTACALFNPSRVVIGGELFHQFGENLMLPLSTRVKEYCLPVHFQNLQFLAGQLGNDAAVLGAVALALENDVEEKS